GSRPNAPVTSPRRTSSRPAATSSAGRNVNSACWTTCSISAGQPVSVRTAVTATDIAQQRRIVRGEPVHLRAAVTAEQPDGDRATGAVQHPPVRTGVLPAPQFGDPVAGRRFGGAVFAHRRTILS